MRRHSCLLTAVSSGFSLPGLSGLGLKKQILQLRSLYALKFDAQINCRPQLICAGSLMCFGFHARLVSIRSKVGCTVIMCDCHVHLFVLKS